MPQMQAFTPFTLPSGLTLKNRLVLAPMTTYSSNQDGTLAADEVPYLERRAKGGFGAIITAAIYVHPTGKAFVGQWSASGPEFLDSLREAADAIHRGGAAAILQLHHGGRQCPPSIVGTPISASAIASDAPNAVVPAAATQEQIEDIIAGFAQAARLAKQAGYEGVEIHGANTYLVQQFVSPHSNRREDEYGANRNLFSIQLFQAVRAAVGPKFTVGYRLSPEEPWEPGIRLGNTLSLIDDLINQGIDFLHVSLRDFRQPSIHGDSEGPVLARIIEHVNGRVPLIGVGSVLKGEDAEALIALGADLVAVGRAAISDPEWPAKVMAGIDPDVAVELENLEENLTLPAGLAAKIRTVEGWFQVKEPAR